MEMGRCKGRKGAKEMKDKAIKDAMVSIENRVRHVYNQGFEEGRSCKLDSSDIEAAYQRGLDDAWKCIEKICAEVIDGGLDSNTLKQIFGTAIIVNIFKTNSASEAIEKIKKYEEQQKKIEKSCDNCGHRCDVSCEILDSGECCINEGKWIPKQTKEKTDKSCDDCRFADLQEYEFPCSACSASHTFRWEARKGASE